MAQRGISEESLFLTKKSRRKFKSEIGYGSRIKPQQAVGSRLKSIRKTYG